MASPSSSDQIPLWLCLYMANLPLEVFVRFGDSTEPERPVVVLERQRVMHLNQAAAKLDIQIGSSMDTAYTLADHVLAYERNADREQRSLEQLAQWAYQFTPQVCCQPPHSLLLNISGCLKLFDGLDNLINAVHQKLTEKGYSAQLGLSYTPSAAAMMARAGVVSSDLNPALPAAETATETRHQLASLPIDLMATEPAVIQGLKQMGIQDMAALFRLPPAGLSRRYGEPFVQYLRQLTGSQPDPRQYIDPKPDFFSEIHFLSDVDNLESLRFPMKRLLTELTQFLTGRQLAISQLHWLLSHRHHPARQINIRLARPENQRDMFMLMTQLELEKLDPNKDIPEVDSLTLAARQFYPVRQRSSDMFEGAGYQAAEHSDDKAYTLMNMIRARLGPERCLGITVADDHRPEKAWRWVQLEQAKPRPTTAVNLPRPPFLLNEPQVLYQTGQPEALDPGKFRKSLPCFKGQPLDLIRGPERIESGWWESTAEHRDYYIARHPDGPLYWVFYDGHDWYLHGLFA